MFEFVVFVFVFGFLVRFLVFGVFSFGVLVFA